ncbi:MAG: hypothetical protein HZC05_00660 [Candidatus Magasanikbacteria bacterium]|nr:hypothetical protein [Candidatus Magasanikbacteria bacterium]
MLTLVGASFLAAWTIPSFIPKIENLAGRALSYEVLMRAYIGLGFFLIAITAASIILWRRRLLWWRYALITLFGALFITFFVFVFDQKYSLTEEYSWIRYPTGGALFVAGFILFWATQKQLLEFKQKMAFWLLGAGLFFAGADELFLIHEFIGGRLQTLFKLPDFTTDLITAGYGLIGLAVLIFIFQTLRRLPSTTRLRIFFQLYFFGIFLFILATVFDSIDGIIFDRLKQFTDALALRGYEFSDVWFIIWQPKTFLNGWEEILEATAAIIFAFGAYLILAKDSLFIEEKAPLNKKIIVTVVGLIVTGIFVSSIYTWRLKTDTPLFGGERIIKIANLAQGLFHTDDLDFNPHWGVVVANESEPKRRGSFTGPGVFTYREGIFSRLPDPDGLLRDVDSIFANDKAIYVSDSSQGKIFIYSCDKKSICSWNIAPMKKNFPKHPEALAVDEKGTITVVDESDGSISQIKKDGSVTVEKPNHPLFKAPEGIVWHPALKKFLITDDTTGIIFQYTHGQPLEVFADKNDGLRYPEDIVVGPNGEVVVSDNGRREIVIFNLQGRVLQRLRFRPLYRDLQGITVDDSGNLFIITADSFGSASFIPSVLWKIEGVF